MSTLNPFLKSFLSGSKCEQIFMRYLSSYPWVVSIERAKGKFYDWDIKMTYMDEDGTEHETTYEIKSDRKSEWTHNFCIEFYNTKLEKPSWIIASKADWYVYYADKKRWMWKREDILAKLMWEESRDIRDGWNDNSRMFVFPVDRLPDFFQEVPNLNEMPEDYKWD